MTMMKRVPPTQEIILTSQELNDLPPKMRSWHFAVPVMETRYVKVRAKNFADAKKRAKKIAITRYAKDKTGGGAGGWGYAMSRGSDLILTASMKLISLLTIGPKETNNWGHSFTVEVEEIRIGNGIFTEPMGEI